MSNNDKFDISCPPSATSGWMERLINEMRRDYLREAERLFYTAQEGSLLDRIWNDKFKVGDKTITDQLSGLTIKQGSFNSDTIKTSADLEMEKQIRENMAKNIEGGLDVVQATKDLFNKFSKPFKRNK